MLVLDASYRHFRFFCPVDPKSTVSEAVREVLCKYASFEELTADSPQPDTLFLKVLDSSSFLPGDCVLGDFGLAPLTRVEVCTLPRRARKPLTPSNDDWVVLNVGGRLFNTLRSTLCKDPDSMLAKMFGAGAPMHASRRDESGAYMLDQEPRYFEPVLNYLRYGDIMVESASLMGVLQAAQFLQVKGAIQELQAQLEAGGRKPVVPREHTRVIIVACRLAAWIGLSGAVPPAVPKRYKFGKTRKYGNQWELHSHSNELLALILNDLMECGYKIHTSSAGGAGPDIAVYQSYVMVTTASDPWVPNMPSIDEIKV